MSPFSNSIYSLTNRFAGQVLPDIAYVVPNSELIGPGIDQVPDVFANWPTPYLAIWSHDDDPPLSMDPRSAGPVTVEKFQLRFPSLDTEDTPIIGGLQTFDGHDFTRADLVQDIVKPYTGSGPSVIAAIDTDYEIREDWHAKLRTFWIKGSDDDDRLVSDFDGVSPIVYGYDGDDRLQLTNSGRLYGNAGDDTLRGVDAGGADSNARSILSGGLGNDDITYFGGRNEIYGGAGDDQIGFGGSFGDGVTIAVTIHGGVGNDTIHFRASTANVFGGHGDDHINFTGGSHVEGGVAEITGGKGADTFRFSDEAKGEVRILDFTVGVDELLFADRQQSLDFEADAEQVGPDVIFGSSDLTIILANVRLSDIDPDDIDYQTFYKGSLSSTYYEIQVPELVLVSSPEELVL